MSKRLFEEEQEHYIQDMIDLQAVEYDREREYMNIHSKNIKNIFSPKIRFKNRRNYYKFAKKKAFFNNKLPF